MTALHGRGRSRAARRAGDAGGSATTSTRSSSAGRARCRGRSQIGPAHRPAGYLQYATFEPTFLYEIIWNLALAAVLIWLGKRGRVRPPGLFALYVAGYSALSDLRGDAADRPLALPLGAADQLLRRVRADGDRARLVRLDAAAQRTGRPRRRRVSQRAPCGVGRRRTLRSAHSRHVDSGITPARISSAKTSQPTQKARNDSSAGGGDHHREQDVGGERRVDGEARASRSAIVKLAPIVCANRFGGPGTGSGAPRRGATTRVANCPSGLSVGPVAERARNP